MDGLAGPSESHGHLAPELARCLAPLITGRVVRVWEADLAGLSQQLSGAASVELLGAAPDPASPADVYLCIQRSRADEFLTLPEVTAAAKGGATVVVCSNRAPVGVSLDARYTAHYTRRPVSGAIIGDPRFSQSRAVALQDSTAGGLADTHLLVWSGEPLPALPLGLFESAADHETVDRFYAARQDRYTEHSRAVALASRLLAVEDRTVELRGENIRLKAALSEQVQGQQGQFFDVPKTKQPWALAEAPDRPYGSLGLYDRRPDDAVIIEAQHGVAFVAAYGLLGETPDFAGAVSALNAMPRSILLDDARPDVSIIIPVYGQLAYTLNCLDSLFRHSSRFSTEIIVVDDCSPDGATAEFAPLVNGIRYHRQPRNGGFIRSCNTGGALARGAYVLMLNSDTRVVARWLDEIIGSFVIFPNAGLVGSKMLYADGVLQEAGGILWRDGGAWNYGREDDPNRPQYCFARKVDYISGCSIALPTPLWNQLSGFDPFYTPAYAEDADICQRVKASGLEVWFQPTSRVVHYEGKTSGTSTGEGIKAYQVVNLKKLFLRWRLTFENHRRNAEAPFFEKERDVRKRMLFVDAVTPTPNQDAGSVQTMLGVRCAQACGYKVHFVPEDNWLFEPAYTPGLQRLGVECSYAPFDVGLENYIRRYGWMFDVILVYRVGVMHKSLMLLREFAPDALLLFHVADLHYLRMGRQAALEGDPALVQAAEDLKERELDVIRQADCTITHSTIEAEILAQEVPAAPVTIWPLMVEVAGTRAPFESRRDICFLGGYRHPPNVDAVIYFVANVLPLIHAVRPEIRFIVAGANPTPEIMALASESILVTGMVEDLADVFDACRVFVCPLRVGAGAKGKVMSSLSHGLPIVSTAIGVEGAGLRDGEHVLVADEPDAMRDALLSVYDDPVLWHSLSSAGMNVVRRDFSLEMGARVLQEGITRAYQHRLGLTEIAEHI